MKRLQVILLFLLLGSFVNIAVAWGLAVWPQTDVLQWSSMTDIKETFGIDHWGDDPRPIPPIVFDTNERHASPMLDFYDIQMYGGVHRFGVDIYSLDTRITRNHACKTEALFSGWPKRSLWLHDTYYFREAVGQSEREFQEWNSGILYITSYSQGIPWRPYWPGFTFNTIVYAILIWAIYFTRFQGFRFIRQWRGLCVKCAYDLRGAEHEACPECGEEIRKGNPA